MQLTPGEIETRRQIVEVAGKIGSRNEMILSAIHRLGNEKLQLRMMKKLLAALEDFHKKRFIYSELN